MKQWVQHSVPKEVKEEIRETEKLEQGKKGLLLSKIGIISQFIMVFIAFGSVIIMGINTKQSKKTIDIMYKEFRLSKRPYIIVDGAEVTTDGRILSVKTCFRNVGLVPANKIQICYKVLDAETTATSGHLIGIPPGAKLERFNELVLKGKGVQEWFARKEPLMLDIKVSYSGIDTTIDSYISDFTVKYDLLTQASTILKSYYK